MSTWYMTEGYRNTILPVDVQKCTTSQVWYLIDYWNNGNVQQERSAKRSDLKQFHETFEAAKQFLIDRETGRWEYHKAQAHAHQSALGSIKKLRIDGAQTCVTAALESSLPREEAE